MLCTKFAKIKSCKKMSLYLSPQLYNKIDLVTPVHKLFINNSVSKMVDLFSYFVFLEDCDILIWMVITVTVLFCLPPTSVVSTDVIQTY